MLTFRPITDTDEVMEFKEDQILQLAPDASSVKAGQQLANVGKWVVAYAHENALWGDCKGSGKYPYRTQIDLKNLAFKCSCPSRKFPCKHALGLLLLYARQPAAFTTASDPDPEVKAWLQKREVRKDKAESKKEPTIDTQAQQKRADAREKKVRAGLDELRNWLKDVIRHGISHIPQQAYHFNKNITSRMVDAQAPGLAARLRKLNDIQYHQEGWEAAFLKKIAFLYLLTEGYNRLSAEADLPAEDIRSQIGWTSTKEEVLQQEGLQDKWLILARQIETEEKLTVERTWLWGETSQRFALLLNFYAPGQIQQSTFFPGISIKGSLAFYPSALPLRALIQGEIEAVPMPQPVVENTFSEIQQKMADALSVIPFQEQFPQLISPVRLIYHQNSAYLLDSLDQSVPVVNPLADVWKILSVTEGNNMLAFVLLESGKASIMGYWYEHSYYTLGQ